MEQINLKIKGMHCASCAGNIAVNLKKAGVVNADVSYPTESARIEYDENKIDLDKIKQVVKDTGYEVVDKKTAHQHEHDHTSTDEEKQLKIKAFLAIILSLPLLARMLWQWEIPGEFLGVTFTDWIQHDLTFIVVFIFGWQFHRNAFKALRNFQTDMDTLISLGTLAAYFYSTYAMFTGGGLYFESAATITALILLGRFLEQKTKDRASRALKKLMELGVKDATVINKGGKEVKVPVEDLNIGDILLVKPSEKIPLDGIVVEGKSNIDESMLSGESLPVFKDKDAKVFAATINQDGVLKIKVTADGANTVLAQIISAVEEAQRFKAPMQRLADKISGIFVPVVVGVALLTFSGWMLYSGDLGRSIIYAVSVLIISCPCALGIATPIAIMVGSSVGARRGILIKNGESFEKAKKVDSIIFDKTGTLTEGKPMVKKIIPNKEHKYEDKHILKISASLAQNSSHPLSKTISEYAKTKDITTTEIIDFKEVPGHGVVGVCKKHNTRLLLGNNKLMKQYNLDLSWLKQILNKYKDSGGTILFISHGQDVIGAILLADEIKTHAKDAIREIIDLNIKPFIISGDNRSAVAAVAKEIGVTDYLAEVLPNDKQAEVKKMQEQGQEVVFAGDGINDAPALVQADLGIAMASGTDIAKESGDIIIMQNDPLKIAEAIRLSKKTFSTIKQNLFWAFFYNVMAIPLAMLGLVNPMIAAIAMSFSDITVIGNSLRIYRMNNK